MTHFVLNPEQFETAVSRNQPYGTAICGRACCRADLTLRPSLVDCPHCVEKLKSETPQAGMSTEAKTFQDLHKLAASVVGSIASGNQDLVVDASVWRGWLDPASEKPASAISSPASRRMLAELGTVLVEAQAEPVAAFLFSCIERLVTGVAQPADAPGDPSNGTPDAEEAPKDTQASTDTTPA